MEGGEIPSAHFQHLLLSILTALPSSLLGSLSLSLAAASPSKAYSRDLPLPPPCLSLPLARRSIFNGPTAQPTPVIGNVEWLVKTLAAHKLRPVSARV